MVFFTNLSLKEFQEFQVGYLALFFFLSNRQFWVILDWKSLQEYPVKMMVFLKAPFLVNTFPIIH